MNQRIAGIGLLQAQARGHRAVVAEGFRGEGLFVEVELAGRGAAIQHDVVDEILVAGIAARAAVAGGTREIGVGGSVGG